MKQLIFNSTPLIYLTKAGLSSIFEQLPDEKYTSSTVKQEVADKGKQKGIPDAIILDKLFTNNVFRVCEPTDKKFLTQLLQTRGLHLADAQVIALAHEYKATAVIDDEVARKTAKVYNIDYVGSPYILMRAACDGIISKTKAKQALQDMVCAGWRCSVESYSKIMDLLDKL